MIELSAADSGSFAPTTQFEKHEIHKVCLRFPNFYLEQNLSLTVLADSIIVSLPGCVLQHALFLFKYCGDL